MACIAINTEGLNANNYVQEREHKEMLNLNVQDFWCAGLNS